MQLAKAGGARVIEDVCLTFEPGSLNVLLGPTLAGKGGSVEKTPFKSSIEDFYLTNPIARASAVMAECSRLASGKMQAAAE